MSLLPVMAAKNLARYKKRTMITASAIAYGLLMFIIMRSILLGIDSESERNLRMYETASGRITAPGYWEEKDLLPLENSFDPQVLDSLLTSTTASASPRISFGGNLVFYQDTDESDGIESFPEDGSIPVKFVAIDPVQDSDVFGLDQTLVEGQWLQDGEYGLVMGHWLAEDIGAVVGSTVVVDTHTQDGYAQAFDLTVVGIVNCPNPEISRNGLFLPLSVADEYLEMDGDVTEVNLNFGLSDEGDASFAAFGAAAADLGLEALDWPTLGADFVAISQAKAGSSAMIIILILVIAAVGISNTMLMAVYERVRELGMLRALGMRDREIRGLFLWESAGIGFLGSIIGVIFGMVVNWPLTRFGIDYSFLLRESNFGYRIQGQMFGVWDFPSILAAFVMGVVMTVFVAAFSTHRILRLDIPSSLRFQ